MQTLQGQNTTGKAKTNLKLCDIDGAGENQRKKQRPLNTNPAEKMNSLHRWFF